jgi:hypothetical protein
VPARHLRDSCFCSLENFADTCPEDYIVTHIFIVTTWCWEECWPSVSFRTACSLVDAVAKSREGRRCAVRVLSIWAARDLLPAKAGPAHHR